MPENSEVGVSQRVMNVCGWNSWDPKGVNRLMHPCLDLEIILATLDTRTGELLDEYSYHVREERRAIAEGKKKLKEMEVGTEEERRLHGKHAAAGVSDTSMGWIRKAGGRALDLSRGYLLLGHTLERGFWEVDFAAGADAASLRISVEKADTDLRFVVMVCAPWGHAGRFLADAEQGWVKAPATAYRPDYGVHLHARAERACAASDHAALRKTCLAAEALPFAEGGAVALVLPFVSFNLAIKPEGADVLEASFAPRPVTGTDEIDLLEACEAVIGWNLCWDPLYQRMQLPVNKEWVAAGLHGMALHNCHFSKRELVYAMGPAVFSWDSGFLSMLTARLNPWWAQEVLRSAVAYNRRPDGGFSTCRMGRHQMDAFTNPPTLTWAAGRIYHLTGDHNFLEAVYPALREWFHWMKRERDRNRDGLYEWGVNPDFATDWPVLMAGRLESGLDNSPMYYDVPTSEEHHTLAMNCVDLCSFQALAAESLASMAEALGRDDEREYFKNEHCELAQRINERLWDGARGIYANRLWSGEFAEAISPTSLYPLTAGIVPPGRANAIIKNWIMNPAHFGGDYPIPSIDAAHPAYNPDGNYWRGRIWGPMSYLVFHGLRRYDSEAARWLADRSAAMFLADWRETGRVFENYSALTGRGKALPTTAEAVCNCDFYGWGGLLALMKLELQES